MKNLKKKEEGFTIIEVLIVLAIAGLIMVIVFLAVPALQRNSRNTQRQNDASRSIAAINECTNNNNGNVTNCLPGGSAIGAYIDFNQNQQLNVINTTGPAGFNTGWVRTNRQCDNTGGGSTAGGGNRAFVIEYTAETSTTTGATRCLQG